MISLTKERISVFELLAAAREVQGTNYVKGDRILCDKRFEKGTNHMVEFKINREGTGLGGKGEYYRRFLTETGYKELLKAAEQNQISIIKHAVNTEGSLAYTPSFTPGDSFGR